MRERRSLFQEGEFQRRPAWFALTQQLKARFHSALQSRA
jgi:hypothetical protein